MDQCDLDAISNVREQIREADELLEQFDEWRKAQNGGGAPGSALNAPERADENSTRGEALDDDDNPRRRASEHALDELTLRLERVDVLFRAIRRELDQAGDAVVLAHTAQLAVEEAQQKCNANAGKWGP
jgi:hypothetical protein